jgi:hypothetical protein
MSSHLLSPDHAPRPLPPVIPDAHHHSPTTNNIPISISSPQPSIVQNALSTTGSPSPDPWLFPSGFVPDGGLGHDPLDDEAGVVIPHR